MAFTFLKVQGYDIANSFHESGQSFLDKYGEMKDIDELARNLLEKAKACNVEVLLPLDHICNVVCEATNTPLVTENENVPAGYMALDIGPRTIQLFQNCIANICTAVWNGPMGVAEISTYATGSFSIAKATGDGTQERGLLSIIGGEHLLSLQRLVVMRIECRTCHLGAELRWIFWRERCYLESTH